MNRADSMQSQDNINKEKKVIYCLWIEWQIFPFADKINKLPEKNRKYVSSNNQP